MNPASHVAETADRQIVSCGGWTLERPGTGERMAGLGHIRHFATHPDWTGLATALLERCLKDGRNARLGAFECNATVNAVGFYAALGFATVEEISVEMALGLHFPSVLMRLQLDERL